MELDAKNPNVGARNQILVQGITVHWTCSDAEGVAVGRGHEARRSEEHRGPGAARLIDAADQQERELSVELPMLVG